MHSMCCVEVLAKPPFMFTHVESYSNMLIAIHSITVYDNNCVERLATFGINHFKRNPTFPRDKLIGVTAGGSIETTLHITSWCHCKHPLHGLDHW